MAEVLGIDWNNLSLADFGSDYGVSEQQDPSPALVTELLRLARLNVDLLNHPGQRARHSVAFALESLLSGLARRMDADPALVGTDAWRRARQMRSPSQNGYDSAVRNREPETATHKPLRLSDWTGAKAYMGDPPPRRRGKGRHS